MVNTRTDAELAMAIQNALQTLLPQIRAEIREEFRTGSRPSSSGGNPLPVTIHTWLECFNKQKLRSFEKATAPVDAENWISHMEKIFDVMGQFWKTVALSTIKDDVMAITATIDRKVKVLITEASIRRHLKLEDSKGLSTLPTEEIFEQLVLMG
nr:hypothetical protein [Tanacetum cinerariifolium]